LDKAYIGTIGHWLTRPPHSTPMQIVYNARTSRHN